jgi:hypothetical protein
MTEHHLGDHPAFLRGLPPFRSADLYGTQGDALMSALCIGCTLSASLRFVEFATSPHSGGLATPDSRGILTYRPCGRTREYVCNRRLTMPGVLGDGTRCSKASATELCQSSAAYRFLASCLVFARADGAYGVSGRELVRERASLSSHGPELEKHTRVCMLKLR